MTNQTGRFIFCSYCGHLSQTKYWQLCDCPKNQKNLVAMYVKAEDVPAVLDAIRRGGKVNIVQLNLPTA